MSLDTPTIVEWGERFPLHDALTVGKGNPVPEGVAGIYLWGFDACKKEIIWYVGKGALRNRLCNHHYHLSKADHQIPKGFLKERFETLADVTSGWKRDRKDPRVAARWQDSNQRQELVRAGQTFAAQAFARVAPMSGKSAGELDAIERAVIFELQPFINNYYKSASNYFVVAHEPSPKEPDWLQSWRATHQSIVEQGIPRYDRDYWIPPEPLPPEVTPEPTPPKPPPTAAQLNDLRSMLIRVLKKLDPQAERQEVESLGGRIGRLSRERKIPRNVAACMRSITEARNMAEYEDEPLTPAQSAAVDANWRVVKEWATAQGIKVPE